MPTTPPAPLPPRLPIRHHLARHLHARCPGLDEVDVHLATRIGDPVDRPRVAVEVMPAAGVALEDLAASIRETAAIELARLPEFLEELVRGRHAVR